MAGLLQSLGLSVGGGGGRGNGGVPDKVVLLLVREVLEGPALGLGEEEGRANAGSQRSTRRTRVYWGVHGLSTSAPAIRVVSSVTSRMDALLLYV